MRQCPKCGKKWPDDEDRCRASYGTPARKCDTVTVDEKDYTDEKESMAVEDLEEGLSEDPFEDEDEAQDTEDLREDLKGQADLIHDLLEEKGPLTYAEIGEAIGVRPKRASNIISVMIRDGVELKREGSPRKVSIG